MSVIQVRDLAPPDRGAFLDMWDDFVSLDPGEPGNRAMGELNWTRLMDEGHALEGIVCTGEGDARIGFTLFTVVPFTWSRGDICYLLDIYVRPGSRGQGAALTMMEHLRRRGQGAGWFKIFWMTQPDNLAARRFYEKIARRMNYLRYDLNINPP